MSSGEMRMRATTAPVQRSEAVGTREMVLDGAQVIAGLQAGALAGIMMGLTVIAVSLSHGWGVWRPFNDVAGALIPGLAAGQSFSLASMIVGVLMHGVLALGLGVLFAVLYAGGLKLTFDFGVPVTVGLAFGLVTWFVARFTVLPLIGSEVYTAPAFLLVHVVFGATLGLIYPMMPANRT